jgi:hypothetical protein
MNSYIKHDTDPWYTACTKDGCKKKVTQGMGNQWHCEKCNEDYPSCSRKFILSLTTADHSGQVWLSMFDDCAIKIFNGVTGVYVFIYLFIHSFFLASIVLFVPFLYSCLFLAGLYLTYGG